MAEATTAKSGFVSRFPMRRRSASNVPTVPKPPPCRKKFATYDCEENPATNVVLAGLAVLRDKMEQTEAMLRKSAENPRADAATLRDGHDLAVLLARRRVGDDVKEADVLFSRALAGQTKLLGQNHPATQRTAANLERLREGVEDKDSFRPSNVSAVWSSFDTSRDTQSNIGTFASRGTFDRLSNLSANEFRVSFDECPKSPKRVPNNARGFRGGDMDELSYLDELQLTAKKPPHHLPSLGECQEGTSITLAPKPPSGARPSGGRRCVGRSLAPPTGVPQPAVDEIADDDGGGIASMPMTEAGLRR